jgi:hypothetical protein
MNIEEQVCDLEHAKKLLTLGVKQKSLFYWGEILTGRHSEIEVEVYYKYDPPCNIVKEYSAFTVSELFDMLPHRITIEENKPFNSFKLRMDKSFVCKDMNDGDKFSMEYIYILNYECDTTCDDLNWIFNKMFTGIWDKSIANAVAKMLIYLIENGHMKNEQ